jgi:hypothetical protein
VAVQQLDLQQTTAAVPAPPLHPLRRPRRVPLQARSRLPRYISIRRTHQLVQRPTESRLGFKRPAVIPPGVSISRTLRS